MEVDEIERQVNKFQRIDSNGDNSSNPHKIVRGNLEHRFPDENGGGGVGGGGGGIVGRLCGWPASRIVRVSRASGGKDRHSKVLTSKGLRDRRVRLSVTTAIQFYDLQDRLGYDQPSKAVEWLIKAASGSIAELPSLDPSFTGADDHHHHHDNQNNNNQQQQVSDEKKLSTGNDNEFEDPNYNNINNNNVSLSKSCSSTSETSKGSGLSLSRSENRVKARERARGMATKKEKENQNRVAALPEISRVARAAVVTQVNGNSHNSSFTDLLTGVPSNASMDYFFNRLPPPQASPQMIQMPQFNVVAGDTNHHHHPHPHPHQHHFSFLPENFATSGGDGGGESYNLNFSIASSASSSGGGIVAPGFNRGTLQSNLVSILPHHHHHLQRFQSPSMVDGSTSTNLPFFIAPDHFPVTGYDSQRRQLYGDGGRPSDHHKEKSKN